MAGLGGSRLWSRVPCFLILRLRLSLPLNVGDPPSIVPSKSWLPIDDYMTSFSRRWWATSATITFIFLRAPVLSKLRLNLANYYPSTSRSSMSPNSSSWGKKEFWRFITRIVLKSTGCIAKRFIFLLCSSFKRYASKSYSLFSAPSFSEVICSYCVLTSSSASLRQIILRRLAATPASSLSWLSERSSRSIMYFLTSSVMKSCSEFSRGVTAQPLDLRCFLSSNARCSCKSWSFTPLCVS